MADSYDTIMKGAKAALTRTEGLAANARASAPLRYGRKPDAATPASRPVQQDAQPKGLRSNAALRRSLTGGKR